MLNLIKEAKDFVFQYVSLLQLMEIVVGVVFILVWFRIIVIVGRVDFDWIDPVWICVIPIALLVGVLQYRSTFVYFLVHSLFVYSLIDGFYLMTCLLPEVWEEFNEGATRFTGYAIHTLSDWLGLYGLICIGLAVLQNKTLRAKYNWNAMGFVKSVIAVLAFKWIMILVDLF